MPTPPNRARPPLRPRLGRALTVGVCFAAGFMMATSAVASGGGDLRPNRSTNLADLVEAQARRNDELGRSLTDLRSEVADMSRQGAQDAGVSAEDLVRAEQGAALDAVSGPAVTVVMADAPLSVKPQGVSEGMLVVHQQDIQAVVNALWSGGAEAMTIQGQRVSGRTGIKCVGNTVVLDAIPYAPPYVITAIGNPLRLETALAGSDPVRIYRQYALAYHLGWEQRRESAVTMPGYPGSVEVQWAKPVR